MSIVEDLVTTARADVDLLGLRDRQGDMFAIPRPVDFIFLAADERQASAVAGFLSDYRYAKTATTNANGEFRVVASISMAVEQPALLAVSGFMQCIASLFRVVYDGWGAPIVKGD